MRYSEGRTGYEDADAGADRELVIACGAALMLGCWNAARQEWRWGASGLLGHGRVGLGGPILSAVEIKVKLVKVDTGGKVPRLSGWYVLFSVSQPARALVLV